MNWWRYDSPCKSSTSCQESLMGQMDLLLKVRDVGMAEAG